MPGGGAECARGRDGGVLLVATPQSGKIGIFMSHPSEKYRAGYFGRNEEIPDISADLVMKAAGLIERMGHERMKPRKDGK